jgi:hypothetical protein
MLWLLVVAICYDTIRTTTPLDYYYSLDDFFLLLAWIYRSSLLLCSVLYIIIICNYRSLTFWLADQAAATTASS